MGKIYGIPPEKLWGSSAKIGRLDEFEKESGFKDEEICYVGDEMIDLGIMGRAGFSVAPADGSAEAQGKGRPCDGGGRRQGGSSGACPIHPRGARGVGKVRRAVQINGTGELMAYKYYKDNRQYIDALLKTGDASW